MSSLPSYAQLGSPVPSRGRGGPSNVPAYARGATQVRGGVPPRGSAPRGNRGRGAPPNRGAAPTRGTGAPSYARGGAQVSRGAPPARGGRGNAPGGAPGPARGVARGGAPPARGGRGNGPRGGPRGGPAPARGGRGNAGARGMARGGNRGGPAAARGGGVAARGVVAKSAASEQFALGEITSAALKANWEEFKGEIEKYLKEIGEVIDGKGAFSLKVLPSSQFCDDEASKAESCLKDGLFKTIAHVLSSFKNNLKRHLEDDEKKILKALCGNRTIVIEIDEKNGGDMFGLVKMKKGDLKLVFVARSLTHIRSTSSSVGGNINKDMANAMVDLEAEGDTEMETKILNAVGEEDKKKIDKVLADFGKLDGGAPFKMETEYSIARMDNRIGEENPHLRGKVYQVLRELLNQCYDNMSYIGSGVAEKVTSRTIEFSFDDMPRPSTGCLQIKVEDGKMILVGPDRFYTTSMCGWSDIGMDFDEATKVPSDDDTTLEELLASLGVNSDSEDYDYSSTNYSSYTYSDSSSDDDYSYTPSVSSSSSSKQKKCAQCKGFGHRVCTYCHGKGCKGRTGCKGTGRANAKCTSCRGTGYK